MLAIFDTLLLKDDIDPGLRFFTSNCRILRGCCKLSDFNVLKLELTLLFRSVLKSISPMVSKSVVGRHGGTGYRHGKPSEYSAQNPSTDLV